MSTRTRVIAGAMGLALLALALVNGSAAAQCTITGPDVVCSGGSVQLCGPQGNYIYEWSLPDGSMPGDRCVNASLPGDYSLMVYDLDTGAAYGPCTHTLTQSDGPVCGIEGPTTGCLGTPVTLCGPVDAASWSWTGPGGFSSTQRCVSVSVSGLYQLTVANAAGCVANPCSQQVTFSDCTPPPSPSPSPSPSPNPLPDPEPSPPPTPEIVNCPRPASFWMRPCVGSSDSRINMEQIGLVAGCVDDHSVLFNWADDAAGMCATLHPTGLDLRARAKREYVGVLANLCATVTQMATSRGAEIGLAASTVVTFEDGSTSIGDWIAAADRSLIALEARPLKERNTKEAYRRIIKDGWQINHGLGIGSVCGRGGPRFSAASFDPDFLGDWSLAEALGDATGAPLELAVTGSNPFSADARLAFTVADDRQVSVAVYDLSGRLMRTLANGWYNAGRYELRWDGRDLHGSPARNGMYFVVGSIAGQQVNLRLTLLR